MRAALAIGLLLGLFVGPAGCGTNALKKSGDSCAASSECDVGLLCDLQAGKCAGTANTQDVDAAIDGFVHDPLDGSGSAKPIDAAIDAAPDAAIDAAVDAAVDAP